MSAKGSPGSSPSAASSRQSEEVTGGDDGSKSGGSQSKAEGDSDDGTGGRQQAAASSSAVFVKSEEETATTVVKVEVIASDSTDDSDEGRMQIRLSVSDDDSDGDSFDSDDFEVFPTTILSVADTAADTAAAHEALVETEPFIPTTFDADDEEDETGYSELTGDAYNSFWKYKKLPKGPKVRQTYSLAVPQLSDPHKPLIFNDPVFDKSHTNTVVHYGKARVGEGNDITPNPHKLMQLGKDIQKINDKMSSLSNSSRNKKEKMKLSSRICRMKRSANHEANKIKFAGLEQEREELCRVIRELKRSQTTSQAASTSTSSLTSEMYQTKVAGRTSEYVNSVLEGEKLPGTRRYLDSDSESD